MSLMCDIISMDTDTAATADKL